MSTPTRRRRVIVRRPRTKTKECAGVASVQRAGARARELLCLKSKAEISSKHALRSRRARLRNDGGAHLQCKVALRVNMTNGFPKEITHRLAHPRTAERGGSSGRRKGTGKNNKNTKKENCRMMEKRSDQDIYYCYSVCTKWLMKETEAGRKKLVDYALNEMVKMHISSRSEVRKKLN